MGRPGKVIDIRSAIWILWRKLCFPWQRVWKATSPKKLFNFIVLVILQKSISYCKHRNVKGFSWKIKYCIKGSLLHQLGRGTSAPFGTWLHPVCQCLLFSKLVFSICSILRVIYDIFSAELFQLNNTFMSNWIISLFHATWCPVTWQGQVYLNLLLLCLINPKWGWPSLP